ncbi:MAG: hypothetical protein CVT72_15865, partial [Alphaproteobacteria bacterium HGW-Alphaproteobacteria-11]
MAPIRRLSFDPDKAAPLEAAFSFVGFPSKAPPGSVSDFEELEMIKEVVRISSPKFDLGGVVPWGRRLCEYRAFFALGDLDGVGPVLDAAGGPSSFTAEAASAGLRVVAADPVYRLPGEAISARFEETAVAMREGMARAAYRFNWRYYGSEAAVDRLRREALALFLADFEAGKAAGRYVP